MTMLSCARQAPAPPAIDPRLAAQVPRDATAIVSLRPDSLVAVRAGQVLTFAPEGNPAAAGAPKSALLADAEAMAARYPMWAVIRGGTALPLEGNLANLNNLIADAELVTIGGRRGDRLALEMTAACASEERARRFEGSLRAVLLLIQAGPGAQVRREGRTVHAEMAVPAELADKLGR